MRKDLTVFVSCIATFAIAVAYVSHAARDRAIAASERVSRVEAQLKVLTGELAELRRANRSEASVHGDATPAATDTVALPTESAPADARPSPSAPVLQSLRPNGSDSSVDRLLADLGSSNDAMTRARAAKQLLATPREMFTLHALRTLLEVDPGEALEGIDRLVAASSDHQAASTSRAAQAIELLADAKSPAVDVALNRYAHSDSAFVQLQAARILARRGNRGALDDSVRQLERDLRSSDLQVQLRSLALLAFAGSASSIREMLPLLQSANSEIRTRAIISLSRFSDPALARSISPLLNDPAPQVRVAAAQALQRLQ